MARPRLIPAVHPTERPVGQAPAIAALRAQIRHLVAFDTLGNLFAPTVLLQGETGTGKGLVARVMYESGPRAQGPFLEVNCAAIPEALLEAELFGFEAGAFTDAKRAKPGLWEAASEGILFLDEIDALPLTLQGKLLTVLEAKRVRRLGAVVEHPVDVKLIAATQADLHARVAEGRFRADLYHRLTVLLLEVPPLHERGDDAVLLAQHFLQRSAEAHRLSPKWLSQGAEAWLRRYAWPGNVRELGHLLERVTLLSPEPVVSPETFEQLCLPSSLPPTAATAKTAASDAMLGDEATQIRQALLRTAGNVARLLGMRRGALRHRIARHGIAPSSQENRIVIPGPQPGVRPGEGRGAGQDERRAVRFSRESPAPAAGWEQKPVAVLAVEVTWPVIDEGEHATYEPWTVSRHWEQIVVEQVRGFGGVLLPHVPSLLVVAFGLPQALEQAPQRAVQAALTLRRLVAETAEREPYPALRLAVHWGQVLVETRESDPPAGFLPMGETLALPLRLLGRAAVGEILVSPVVGRLIAGWFELQARAGSQDTEGYVVVGLKARPSPLRMHGQRPLSRFVGRERQLAALEELLEQAKVGRGQVLGLGGEPGVGKSRLLYEFRQSLTGQRITYLEGHCLSYGSTIPYLPVIDLLRQQFGITAADSPDAIITRARICLQEVGMDPDQGGAYLLQLLGVQAGIERPAALSPEVIKARTFETLWQLYLRSSQQQPLVLAVENLHWTDQTSEDLLASLVEHLAGARILLLLTYRPGYRPRWMGQSYVTQMVLPPLSSQDGSQMLQAILQTEQMSASLAQMILAKAQGNPFFLEEIVQALVEQGVLAPAADGRMALATPMPPRSLAEMAIPPTVQEVLAARLDRLPPQERGLLQMAAVIGTEVPWPLLQAIADTSDAALSHSLSQLQAAEFLYETSLFPELAYTFKHALTHEVAYGNLLKARRCALHARILEAIEALYPDRLAERVERLAHHAFQGKVWEKAVVYLRQAGTKAAAHTAYREAVACFERALVALQHLPESCWTIEQAIDLRFDLRSALRPLGELGRVFDYLREAETLAAGLDDPRRLGWVASYMTDYFWRTGDPDRAIDFAQQALCIAAAVGDFALHIMVNQSLGVIYYGLGDYQRAIDGLRRNVASLTGELIHFRPFYPPSVMSRYWLAFGLAERGEFGEGIACGEEGIQIAEAIGQPYNLINAYHCVGSVYLRKGDLQKAVAVLERGLDLFRVADVPSLFPPLASALGYAYALSGGMAEGLSLLGQAVEKTVSHGRTAVLSLWIARLGEAYVLAQRLDEAVQHAQHALSLSRDHKEQGHEAWALRLLGEISAHRKPPDIEHAEECYRQSLALADKLGMRPLLAHCHCGLGTLYAKIGQPERARPELTAAIELYRSMEMTFWLPQAEAALARVG